MANYKYVAIVKGIESEKAYGYGRFGLFKIAENLGKTVGTSYCRNSGFLTVEMFKLNALKEPGKKIGEIKIPMGV